MQQVGEALEKLKSLSLLAYSEKQGYKIKALPVQEWRRERDDIGVPQGADQQDRAGGAKDPGGLPSGTSARHDGGTKSGAGRAGRSCMNPVVLRWTPSQ